MSNEVTIDELRIEIEAESGTAASNLDDLAKSLGRLQAVTQRMTGGGDGLNKVAKQIEKLNAISQNIRSMRGFERLGKVVNQLAKLDRLSNVGDISGFVRNLSKLPQAVNAIAQMPSIDTAKFQQIADALKPLNDLGTNNINSFLRTLGKFPQTAQQLAGVDLTQFEQQIRRISTSLEPLTRQAERGGAGLTALAQIMQSTSRQARQSSSGVSLFNQTIGNIKVKTLAAIAGLRRLFSVLKSSVTTSNDYVENLNLFTVTMGGAADEALKFAEAVNSALGVDVSDWIRYQGVFKQMTSGFGMIEEKANLVSKNLTQLGFDISSYFNISVDDAMQKLQSGMAGEQEPLRRLGYALDEATIKQVALNHGITESVTNMSQAQKAQLRYIAIMEQSTNAMGDMARTIDSPANQIRILEARIQTLKRAIGDSLMPVVSAALPYITAFVQILGEAFRGVAEFMGFELPEFDYSDVMTKQNENIANSFDDATEASNKFKGTLAGIDQLNIIGSKDEGKSSAGNENQFDLGLELPEYDFLQGVESKTKQIVEDIKAWLPVIGAVGSAIAGAFAISKISKFTDGIKNIATIFGKNIGTDKLKDFSKTLGGIVGGLAAGASSGILLNSGIKNLITGTGKLGGNIAKVASGAVIAGGAIATFVKLGNPVGAVITGIGALAGVFIGIAQAQKELNQQIADSITYADNGGIAIEGLAKGYENYFDEISNGYDDIISANDAMKENASKIKTAADEVLNITDKYRDMNGVMAGEDAQTIKDNIKEIGTLSQDYLGKQTADLIDTLTTKFSTFAEELGIKVDDLSGKLKLLQGIGESKIEQFTQQANDLVDTLSSGALHGEDFQKALDDLDDVTQKLSIPEVTAESVSFTRALQEMSKSAVNFTPETAVSSIEELGEMADAAREKLKQAQLEQLANIQASKQYYKQLGADVDFNAKMKAEGVDITFDDLWVGIEKALDTGYSSELKKIDIGQAAFISQIQTQFDKNAQKYAQIKFDDKGAGLGSWIKNGGFLGRGDDLYYQAISDYTKEYKKTDTGKALQDAINSSLDGLNIEGADKIGEYLMRGMANGVIKDQEDLNRALDAAANGAIDEVKRICGVHSPSTVFADIGGYLMQGMALGIDKDRHDVISSLDNTTKTMFCKMKGLSFNVPTFNAENAAVNMDMNTIYERVKKETASFNNNSYTIPAGTAAIGSAVGAAREAFPNAAQSAAANGGSSADININLQSYVELDGEQVGQAVSQYQQRQMAYSNGQ